MNVAHFSHDPLARLEAVKRSDAMDSRFRTFLRLVEIGDADFVCALRGDSALNTHLNAPPTDVTQQRTWIANYKIRETQGREFYFVIVSDGARRGVVRMYDFRVISGQNSFSWGSWIIPPPRSPGIVTFSAIAMYELGFDVLKFDRAHFDIAKANTRVREFHERTGAELESEDGDNQHFRFTLAAFARFRQASEKQIQAHRTRCVLAGR